MNKDTKTLITSKENCFEYDEQEILDKIDYISFDTIFDLYAVNSDFMEYLVLNNRHKLQGNNILDKMSLNFVLSEYFMTELKDQLDWDIISSTQLLSEEFIENHAEYVNWKLLKNVNNFSNNFLKRHNDKLCEENTICTLHSTDQLISNIDINTIKKLSNFIYK